MRVGHDLEQAIPFAVDQGARHDIQRRGRGLHVMAGPAGGLLRESDRGKVRGPLLPHRSNSDTRPLRLADEPLVKGTYLGVGLPALASTYLFPRVMELRDVSCAGCRDKQALMDTTIEG